MILTTVPFTYWMYQIYSPDLRIYRSIPPKNGWDICVRYGHHGQGGNPDRLIDKSISWYIYIYIVILNRFEREHTSQAIVLHRFSHLAFSCELVDWNSIMMISLAIQCWARVWLPYGFAGLKTINVNHG